ncbi:SIP domain-containing protein [Mucilaginibacter sp. X5P1]|uniref:SIP domain-containing protein n=1 Tax=Mucilaginibacter sp. X5P1 TaxID=2723088 RepID=UPI001613FFD8|nr:SIP domain-containing protein [Mucilaginibacter sp. X5P1]MBB6142021.1 NADPH-dependent ferric siderophore reductase [Mucilaginibacter sp. X5P1]
METSTLHKIKQKAERWFEPSQLNKGRVLEVRHWEPSTVIEIDLHLPNADMYQWTEIPYIKFKVETFTYRDYSPSGWDAETRTCTLFIDAAHKGVGTNWARNLKKDDEVSYLKIGTSHHAPEITPAIISLGDESSLGHMLALQQMVLPAARFSGAVLMADEHHRDFFNQYFPASIQTVARHDVYGHHSLIKWVTDQNYSLENTMFYLAGNNMMVSQLRRMLRLQGYSSGQIKAKGFWS